MAEIRHRMTQPKMTEIHQFRVRVPALWIAERRARRFLAHLNDKMAVDKAS